MSIVDEVAVVQRRIIMQAAFTSAVLAGLAAFSGRWPEAWGVIIGTLVAILNFSLLAKNIRSLIAEHPKRAQVKARLNYIGRYFLMAAVIFYSFTTPTLNMYAVVVGMLLIKAVILAGALFTFCKERLSLIFQHAPEERGDR